MNTDTLTTAKELEAKGVEPTAAEAIAAAIHNHTQTQFGHLVTKTDLALARISHQPYCATTNQLSVVDSPTVWDRQGR